MPELAHRPALDTADTSRRAARARFPLPQKIQREWRLLRFQLLLDEYPSRRRRDARWREA